MLLHLQNLRTGEVHALDPARTLVGAAEHAAVPTGGPHLAALCVRYPAGWAIHGLSDDPAVRFANRPLAVGRRATPRPGDLLEVGADRFQFLGAEAPDEPPAAAGRPPVFFAYVRDPEGMEECRVVDHDLLIGRLTACHVRFPDKRLSRVTALLAAHAGGWYLHALATRPIVARNRQLVTGPTPLADGDELLLGPLAVRVELTDPADAGEAHTDVPADHDTAEPSEPAAPAGESVRAAAVRLDRWLQRQTPSAAPPEGGLGGWLSAQKARLSRFWLDTPETTAARGLRSAGRVGEAFAVLDRAVRARPDSPALLRELYRLYEAAGLADLCYRPLRQIEKLAEARGESDPWVLEALARVCERVGQHDRAMFDKAMRYWGKLEAATGVSYERERSAAMATRTLREGGFEAAGGDERPAR